MTTNPLDEIQARADATTEGPWEAVDAFDENGEDWLYSEIKHTYRADGIVWPNQILGTVDLDEADAVFIAHAREDVPRLVAALRAVEAVHVPEECCGDADCRGLVGCLNCHEYWPCETVTAIREALG